MFATIDLAFARPTLKVVFGSRFGGGGGWGAGPIPWPGARLSRTEELPPVSFLGSVL